jgi:hypothetical protein
MKESAMRALLQTALICVVFLAATSPVHAGGIDAQAAFDELRSLAGTWRGTPEGEGEEAEAEAKKVDEVIHEFRVSAAGTVVMETMGPGTEHEMINMYHHQPRSGGGFAHPLRRDPADRPEAHREHLGLLRRRQEGRRHGFPPGPVRLDRGDNQGACEAEMFSRSSSIGVLAAILGGLFVASCQPVPEPPSANLDSSGFPVLTGNYLGQEPPGAEPELFAPGIVSTGLGERDVAMTPDGNELYYTAVVGPAFNFGAIVVTKRVDGVWTPPEVATFSGHHMDLEPAISPDGQRFFFMSTRPVPGATEATGNEDIWVMNRSGEGWGEPYNVGSPINTEGGEFFPSVTADGTLYFTRKVAEGSESIYRSRLVDGVYSEPEMLPEQVNSGQLRFNAFVARDESYIIVPVWGREDSLGGVDYYIVFRSPEDVWSDPINMGENINAAEGAEWSPYVSPDGNYLFFMSSRATIQDRFSPVRQTYESLQDLHNRPMNGSFDIWWTDAGIIEELRPAGF